LGRAAACVGSNTKNVRHKVTVVKETRLECVSIGKSAALTNWEISDVKIFY
jgi:hypothetical protein